MKHSSEYVSIEITNGGFILTYDHGEGDDVMSVREVVANQRKLINRLKELIAEKSYVPAA